MWVLLLFAIVLVFSVSGTMAYRRHAALRRSQLSNDRIAHLAASLKKGTQRG